MSAAAPRTEVSRDDVVDVLREWCAGNPKFDDDAFDRSVNSILASEDDDTISRAGVGSLDRLAREYGYRGPPPTVALRDGEMPLTDQTKSESSPAAPAAPGTRERDVELVAHFTAVLAARGSGKRRAKRFRDVAQDPAPQWAVQGWLPKGGVVAVFGESGVFKTYIAINLLLCGATGTPWAARPGFAGYRVGEARPVVLFAGEGAELDKQRINAAIDGNGFDRELAEENLIFVDDVYALNRAEGLAAMAAEIEVLGVRPGIIVVDTLNLALDGNEDSSEEVKKAIRGARALAIMFDAVVIVIDHAGHGDKTRQRGSSAKKANQDGVILCARTGDKVVLTQGKNRGADDKPSVAFAARKITLGTCPHTGEAITDLWFETVDPGACAELFEDQTAGQWDLLDARACAILDAHTGLDIKATDLAQMVLGEEMPDLKEAEPVKFVNICDTYRQHMVRAFRAEHLKKYVASWTPKHAASTFCNPTQNGHRARRPRASAGAAA